MGSTQPHMQWSSCTRGKAAGGVKLIAYRHLGPKLRMSFLQLNTFNGVNGDSFTSTFGNCFLADSSHLIIRRCMSTSRLSEQHRTFIQQSGNPKILESAAPLRGPPNMALNGFHWQSYCRTLYRLHSSYSLRNETSSLRSGVGDGGCPNSDYFPIHH